MEYLITLSLFAFVAIGSVAIACWAIRWFRNRAEYYRGYVAGRNEERSFTNARMIPAKLAAFKKGKTVGLAQWSWASRN